LLIGRQNIALIFAAAVLAFISCERSRRDVSVAKAGSVSLEASQLKQLIPEGFEDRFGDDALQFVSQWTENVLLSEAALKLHLDERKDVAAKIEDARRMILASAAEQYLVLPRTQVDSAEVVSYYQEHSEEFIRQKDEVLIEHIALDDSFARDSVAALLDSIPFEELAERFSIYPADVSQGYLSRDRMHRKLAKAAFSLSEGEHAGPIDTEFGYYFIKLVDFAPKGSLREFSEVEQGIRDYLSEERFREVYADVMDSLRSVEGVSIDTNAIEEALTKIEN